MKAQLADFYSKPEEGDKYFRNFNTYNITKRNVRLTKEHFEIEDNLRWISWLKI